MFYKFAANPLMLKCTGARPIVSASGVAELWLRAQQHGHAARPRPWEYYGRRGARNARRWLSVLACVLASPRKRPAKCTAVSGRDLRPSQNSLEQGI